MIIELHNTDNLPDTINILSTDDEKLKNLGEVLSSDNGRLILKEISDHEMTAAEIANKTNLSLELVRYHLKKLLSIGIIKITKIEKNRREQDMKYYRSTKFLLMVVHPAITEQARKNKSLINSIKKIYRFAAIGIAGLGSWFIANSLYTFNEIDSSKIGAPISSPPGFWISMSVTLSVIILGLIVERVLISRSKFQKQHSNHTDQQVQEN